MKLVELINSYLKFRCITKLEFAERIGITRGVCSNALTGRCEPSDKFIQAVISNEEIYSGLVKHYYFLNKKKKVLKPKSEVIADRHKNSNRESVYY